MNFNITKKISDRELNKVDYLIKNNDDSFGTFLNEGYNGKVYRYNRDFIIKVFKNEKFEDHNILMQLNGVKNIPQLHAYGKQFIIVDYVKGQTLIETKKINMDWEQELINSFIEIEKRELYPKDITHENLLVDKEGLIWIIDVGEFNNKYIKKCSYQTIINRLKRKINL